MSHVVHDEVNYVSRGQISEGETIFSRKYSLQRGGKFP